mgnify:CR=1 FL=1
MPRYCLGSYITGRILPEILCLVCDEHLFTVKAACHGQVTHCSSTQRYIARVVEGVLSVKTREHSPESYNPLNIWSSPTMRADEKLRALKRLRAHLQAMKLGHLRMFDTNLTRCKELEIEAQKSLLDPAVADSYNDRSKAFDVKVKRDRDGGIKVWKFMLQAWARANTELETGVIDARTKDTAEAVRFAREIGSPVPKHLEWMK